MLVIIAGVFCMLLAFSSMWLAWYVLMPHDKKTLLDGTTTPGHVSGGSVREIFEESVLHHHHNAPKI